MNTISNVEIPQADPQAEAVAHGIAIAQVGISRVQYPILISGWETTPDRHEVKDAEFALNVSLAAEKRGIHMSRLLENINHWDKPLSPATMPEFLREIRASQGAGAADVSCTFTWFIQRPSPRTERPAWQGIAIESCNVQCTRKITLEPRTPHLQKGFVRKVVKGV